MQISLFKKCCMLAVASIVLFGCRTAEVYETTQLANYIDFISCEGSRSLPDVMLVGACATTQEHQSKYSVIFADEKYISFRAEEFSYTGGAHGNTEITVGTIDRKTGHRLRLADFISEDKLSRLAKILHAKVVKKLGGEENLQGEVRPIENFCVVKDGLRFVYNEYEVACYAAGAVEVFASFDELRQ